MNGLALCAGAGGLELGLHLAIPSYCCVGYVERETFAASSLVARMEDKAMDRAPIYSDLESTPSVRWSGSVDIVSAGFPCQPVSVAGKKLGADDERWLWPLVHRCIRDVGPRFVFLENVPGIVTRGLDSIVGGLAEIGFLSEWDCFSAGAIGAPHRRERFFLFAWRVSDPDSGRLRKLPERGEGPAQTTDGRDTEPLDLGEEDVADSDSHGPQGIESDRSAPRTAVGSGRAEVGDAAVERGLAENTAGPSRNPSAQPGGEVGDADSGRREGEWQPEYTEQLGASGDEPHRSDQDRGLEWPPGPEDAEGWRAYIDAGGPEPAIRGGPDGPAARVDRLRALGNGVVPIVAARAIITLARRAGVSLT